MRIVVLASGAFAESTIRWLAQSGHEVPLIVTQPSRGSGRGRKQTPTPVRVLADELKIPSAEMEDVNSPESLGLLKSLSPRILLVIAFGQKLGSPLLQLAPCGAINLHASLLPKYRGAAPINWAIVNGETQTGCTVFQIVSKMDAGPIFAQDAADILPDETAGELHDRLAILGVQTVQAALAMFEQTDSPVGISQDDALATKARKLKKTDGYIDFAAPAREVYNRIRGMSPWPGATATFVSSSGRNETITIVGARCLPEAQALRESPGTLDAQLHVQTVDGVIEVLAIQPAGSRAMSWADFVNGRHVRPGDRFETPR